MIGRVQQYKGDLVCLYHIAFWCSNAEGVPPAVPGRHVLYLAARCNQSGHSTAHQVWVLKGFRGCT